MPEPQAPRGAATAVDVVVVGGGGNGILLACLLLQRGMTVRVLERRKEIADRPRAFGIHPAALAALDAVGVGDAVRAEALTLAEGAFVGVDGRRATVTFDSQHFIGPVVLGQNRVEQLLETRLRSLDPRAFERGATVTRVCDTGTAVCVEAIAGDDSPLTIEAARVVLVDGTNGELSEQLAGPAQPVGPRRWYAMAEAEAAPNDAAGTVALIASPDGVVESFPLPGGRRRWVLWRDTDAPLDAEGLGMLIRHRTTRSVGRIQEPVSVFAAQSRRRRSLVHGRIVIAGDAAMTVSPIGGQGLTIGWAAAQVLADELATTPVDGGRLRRYERAVNRMARRAQRRASFFMRLGDPTGPRDLLRAGAVRVLALRSMRRVVYRLVVVRRP
jgi:2-polyprenyl-6-methoxyphenol hydroxylase-like FAD-dependent oxidoreductase